MSTSVISREEILTMHRRFMFRFPSGRKRGIGSGCLPLVNLNEQDVRWLQELSHGLGIKQLSGVTSYQAAKNRVMQIRFFLGASTIAQAVAVALRNRIIK